MTMTLSSAEKLSSTCPWKFPPVSEDLMQSYSTAYPSNNNNLGAVNSHSAKVEHETLLFSLSLEEAVEGKADRSADMGNISSGKTKDHKPPTPCYPLPSDKKSVQHKNDLNSKQPSQPTHHTPTYIDTKNGSIQSVKPVSDKLPGVSVQKMVADTPTQVPGDQSKSPPQGVSTDGVKLTLDVNNSRPSSRSNTPLQPRKNGSNGSYLAQSHTEHKGSSNSLKDSQAKDIMISYSHLDKEIMLKLKDALEHHNISVWVDVVGLNAGVNFLNKIGQAIIDSKMFITLLTERTVASKFCQDELALAYISNKPIFPVSLQPQSEIFPKIPTGMKLQLARFEWTQISVENFNEDIQVLLKKLQACLDDMRSEGKDDVPDLSSPPAEDKLPFRKTLKRKVTRPKLYQYNRSLSRCNSIIEQTEDIDAQAEFWDRNFGDLNAVQFDSFEASFTKDYERQLNMTYALSDREWFIDILKRELEVEEDGFIHKEKYKEFITEELDGTLKEQPILKCVNDLAVENYTMKEVFNMDSSVRLDAINNLAKFGSVAVVEALLDLLDDQEHDVRATACISLAKSKAGDLSMKIDRLMRCLRDSDRFVRESACVALGLFESRRSSSCVASNLVTFLF
ncbi:hypothetical protein EB796_010881 [Bugula neritina]|uniref:TIR domain-containing protein n=1 Tax=Bugula neritina TaxID=10212 RepID=A0A7J7JY34_BUGNE|nr:hypothetical protein EB796_010881 [Bugula neritina]